MPELVPVVAPFPVKSPVLTEELKQFYQQKIFRLLKSRNAVLIAHYYTDPDIQALAEASGGCVADSLEMARFGAAHPATTLLVAGVRFMGETAKILCPEKNILMPSLAAECSLDLGCPAIPFSQFCDQHSDRTVVVYANTSAAVKARADWVVTSSIAVELIEYLDSRGEKILWAPDRHLGSYVASKTGADMLCWQGACLVHDEFRLQGLLTMKKLYPDAAVLVHPESPAAIVAEADAVGSTSQLIQAAKTLPHQQMIVATDRGIFYKMQQSCPEKQLIEAPTGGDGATCRACSRCPWMAMNSLQAVAEALESNTSHHQIHIDERLQQAALRGLHRMLDFSHRLKNGSLYN